MVPQLLEVPSDELEEMLAKDRSSVLRAFMAKSFWDRFALYLKDSAAVFYRVVVVG